MIKTVPVTGELETRCYFFIDEKTGHGFIIDPGAEADRLLSVIQKNHWIIEKILLTHGHFDHIGAVQRLHEVCGIPYFIHENGKQYLENISLNLSCYCSQNIILTEANYVKEGDYITLSTNPDFNLRVIHTPGHTEDSILLYNKKYNFAFCGDTIFKGSIGATHFPGGNIQKIEQSILQKIFTLPLDTELYSGHSEKTTVSAEKGRYIY